MVQHLCYQLPQKLQRVQNNCLLSVPFSNGTPIDHMPTELDVAKASTAVYNST